MSFKEVAFLFSNTDFVSTPQLVVSDLSTNTVPFTVEPPYHLGSFLFGKSIKISFIYFFTLSVSFENWFRF